MPARAPSGHPLAARWTHIRHISSPLTTHLAPASPCCRLNVPAYAPSGQPLTSLDVLLVCDSYIGLDQQYSVPLSPGSTGSGAGGAGGGSRGGALPLPPAGQAARRQRRDEQLEPRRQRPAAAEGEQQQQQQQRQRQQGRGQQRQQQGGAPTPARQATAAAAAPPPGLLPQRAPRARRNGPAAQLEAAAAPTLECRRAGSGQGDEGGDAARGQ